MLLLDSFPETPLDVRSGLYDDVREAETSRVYLKSAEVVLAAARRVTISQSRSLPSG